MWLLQTFPLVADSMSSLGGRSRPKDETARVAMVEVLASALDGTRKLIGATRSFLAIDTATA